MAWFGHKKLGVAVMCADWRLHHPRVDLYKRLCRFLHVDGLDVAAIPGPDGLLDPIRAQEWDAVAGWVKLLVSAHKPAKIALVAHQRFAGHSASDGRHEHGMLETAMALKANTGFSGPVVAVVAIEGADARWHLKKIGEYVREKPPERMHS